MVIFGGWIIAALIAGILCALYIKIGIALLGAGAGGILFLLVYNIFLHSLPSYILLIGISCSAIILGIISYLLYK